MVLTIYKHHTNTKGHIFPVNVRLAKDSVNSLPWSVEAEIEKKTKLGLNIVLLCHVIYTFLIALSNRRKSCSEYIAAIFTEEGQDREDDENGASAHVSL